MPKGIQINSISSCKDHVCKVSENQDFRWIVITRITLNLDLKPPFGIPRFRFESFRLSLGVIMAAKKWTRISAIYFMLNSFIEVHAEFGPNESFQMTIESTHPTLWTSFPISNISFLANKMQVWVFIFGVQVGLKRRYRWTRRCGNFEQ